VERRPEAEPAGAGLADERISQSLPDRIRLGTADRRRAVMGAASVHERPYTLLSCALSIDGYLGGTTLRRLELSNEADFDRVDAVRASCDAILVGAATVRHDNPRLLVRSEARREARKARGMASSPIKVTVTSGAELDPGADFFASGDSEKLVYCTSERVNNAQSRLGPVATVLDGGQPVDMRRLSEDLAGRGVERLMVEGGGTVHTQFLTGNLADELQLVVAPFFVGDSRATRFVRDGRFPWNPDRRATLSEVRQIGDVVLLRYALSSRFQDC
jgi:5-amino-6-(5-phosphoribosylamino)uracil reductase